ncbi:nucleotidyl transferase AbiEii/AbiGii toxin family protein [Candidatus Saganbacteria bacterium]|nr:nucleotidyl transferase AbiEii/AbiGii toxin family protein [Candidatus Saganbacteria bacterium]
MLTYEALLEYAKNKGMPTNKIRGILREYIQTLILKHLYRHPLGKRSYFLGGTYLRFVHGFKRFSEDLDFNGEKFKKNEFVDMAHYVQSEFERENLNSGVDFDHRGNLLTAKFTFNRELQSAYQLIDARGQLMVKVEIHQPSWELKTNEVVVNNFGEMFPIFTMTDGYIFCEKMLALSTHRRGRHVYDLIMMLSKKFPVDDYILREKKVNISPREFLKEIIFAIPDKELEKMANSLRPFLFEEKEAEYVERAKFYIEQLLSA